MAGDLINSESIQSAIAKIIIDVLENVAENEYGDFNEVVLTALGFDNSDTVFKCLSSEQVEKVHVAVFELLVQTIQNMDIEDISFDLDDLIARVLGSEKGEDFFSAHPDLSEKLITAIIDQVDLSDYTNQITNLIGAEQIRRYLENHPTILDQVVGSVVQKAAQGSIPADIALNVYAVALSKDSIAQVLQRNPDQITNLVYLAIRTCLTESGGDKTPIVGMLEANTEFRQVMRKAIEQVERRSMENVINDSIHYTITQDLKRVRDGKFGLKSIIARLILWTIS